MLPHWTLVSCLLWISSHASNLEDMLISHRRYQRQILGDAGAARTTDEPFIDTDLAGSNTIGLTSAPAIDETFGGPPPTSAPAATPAPGTGPTRPPPSSVTKGPKPAATTFRGYLASSPYPFALPPPDIPFLGSKWNGPWGYPGGQYQSFRGTGQYIAHYQYYPISYFGSLMTPIRYGISGKK